MIPAAPENKALDVSGLHAVVKERIRRSFAETGLTVAVGELGSSIVIQPPGEVEGVIDTTERKPR